MKSKVLAIIPARYASTRFPGKPLALLGDKPVIEHVVKRVQSVVSDVVVATDDTRILSCVKGFGGKAVMTSSNHKSGTDRCGEALGLWAEEIDIVINLQGDEPFVQPQQIELLISLFNNESVDIATLAEAYPQQTPNEVLFNPNQVKVVTNGDDMALYFSRNPIPYYRNQTDDWCKYHTYLKHIGIYAFRADVLKKLGSLRQTNLELAESLEQLRWLEHGYKIKVGLTETATIGIDTPEDLARAEAYLKKQSTTK